MNCGLHSERRAKESSGPSRPAMGAHRSKAEARICKQKRQSHSVCGEKKMRW